MHLKGLLGWMLQQKACQVSYQARGQPALEQTLAARSAFKAITEQYSRLM